MGMLILTFDEKSDYSLQKCRMILASQARISP